MPLPIHDDEPTFVEKTLRFIGYAGIAISALIGLITTLLYVGLGFTEGAPRALALTKRALDTSFEATLEAQLEDEAALQGIAGRTADHREGVAAFLEKRPPRFTGE